jgi:hypothetical protein
MAITLAQLKEIASGSEAGRVALQDEFLSTDAGTETIGDASATTLSELVLFDGGSEKPAIITLYDHAGVPHYLWVDNTGDLRIHTSKPSNEDSDGTVVGAQS